MSPETENPIVNRYARSLYEVSISIKMEADVLRQMQSVKKYVLAVENYKKALKKDSLLRECGLEFVSKLKKELKPSPEVSAFLDLLHKNKRLTMIVEICDAYISLADKENSRATILVTYAKKFPKTEEKKLVDNMREILGRRVLCITQRDQTLVDGIKIQYRSKILDYSIKSRLDHLCNAITGSTHEN
ncbi:MAG: ATP synthase F1 subunit delta [Holosporaceae bacterium]|nr:ATP synthase F1 subunit delta [Holosporaceae bacterium]